MVYHSDQPLAFASKVDRTRAGDRTKHERVERNAETFVYVNLFGIYGYFTCYSRLMNVLLMCNIRDGNVSTHTHTHGLFNLNNMQIAFVRRRRRRRGIFQLIHQR